MSIDKIAIQPFQSPCDGSRITPPGSKSISNRALLLAALSDSEMILEGALFSRDTHIMLNALEACGFLINASEADKKISIHGQDGTIPNAKAKLHVGNAGTAARFLTAMLCLRKDGEYYIDSDEAMRKRPMQGLLQALEDHGAASFQFDEEAWHFPFRMQTHGLSGGSIQVDASASSQMLSALLMIAPFASEPLKVERIGDTVSKPFVEMTLNMMDQFGYHNAHPEGERAVNVDAETRHPYKINMPIRKNVYHIESDATAASYFLSLPIATKGSIEVTMATHSMQGDTAYLNVLEACGLGVERLPGNCTIRHQEGLTLKGVDIDFNAFSDTFLTFAALAPLLSSPTVIRGIGHTRHQETDRIRAMANELKKLGQEVLEHEDKLEITPRPLKEACIDTYEDHRVAMSFAILGSYDLHGNGTPWLQIKDPMCCTKTWPHFFNVLENLRQKLK